MIELRMKTESYQHSQLGKEIKISPKSHVAINKEGAEYKFESESIQVEIKIGKDASAFLIMSAEAWEELKKGEEVTIGTLKEFKEIFVK